MSFDGTPIFRSSLALEREVAEFMRRTGQVECVFNHGLVTGPHYAMPLNPRPCVCKAEL